MKSNNIHSIIKDEEFDFTEKKDNSIELDELSSVLVREYIIKNITQKNIALKCFLNDIEKRIIVFTLGLTNGNQKIASKILGVKQTSLCEKIKKYDLQKEKKRVLLNLELINMDENEIKEDLFV